MLKNSLHLDLSGVVNSEDNRGVQHEGGLSENEKDKSPENIFRKSLLKGLVEK